MYRVKAMILAVLAVFALMVSVLAATSEALPEVLNAAKEATAQKYQTPGGTEGSTTEFSVLSGFSVAKCSETSAEGEIERTNPLGPFHILFKGCTTNLGGTCTGLGDTAGTILVLGSAHLVFDTLGATLGQAGVAMLLLLQHVHYQCTVAGIERLVLILGKLLCLVKPVNTLAKGFTLDCLGTGGDPKEVHYWIEAGAEVNITEGLLTSENEGVTYVMSTLGAEAKIEFSNEVEIRT